MYSFLAHSTKRIHNITANFHPGVLHVSKGKLLLRAHCNSYWYTGLRDSKPTSFPNVLRDVYDVLNIAYMCVCAGVGGGLQALWHLRIHEPV
jgi:hypothetical protein